MIMDFSDIRYLALIKDFVALDLETTGLDPKNDRIIEIGAVKFVAGERISHYESFVNPRMLIPERITGITGIDDSMVEGAPFIEEVLPGLLEFIGELPILGHNILFDYSFIKRNAVNMKTNFMVKGMDTHKISKKLLSELPSRSLEKLCIHYGIEEEPRHRAFSDAAAAARLYFCLYEEALLHDMEPEERQKMFAPKELIYQVKKEGPVTKKQVEFLKKLIKLHNIDYDKEIESLTKNQASREIDIILSTYGRLFN